MTMTGLSPRSATDLQGLQRLKQTARSESGQAEALQEASRQFEALFLQMMLKKCFSTHKTQRKSFVTTT